MTSPGDPGVCGSAAADSDAVLDPQEPAPHQPPHRTSQSHISQRRIDEVFGDVLSGATGQERAAERRSGFSREHYASQRPPHHVSR